MTEHTNTSKETSFFRELTHRRVPQVLGLYLVGSWTFMEFSNSLIERHNLSTHWSDISLITLFMMLPTVLILAYRHGAPGAQNWTYVEKLGIPANVLLVCLVIFLNYSNKDLSNRAELVEATAPDGSVMTVVRPKEAYRKRIMIGYFKRDNDTIDEALQFGISYALTVDLDQDPYTNTFHAMTSSRPLIEADFTEMSAPLPFMLNIARNNLMEYYLDGRLSVTDENKYILSVTLYNVDNGNKITELSSQPASSLFAAVDNLSPQIKVSVGLPQFIIDESQDLPVDELITSNKLAFNDFIKGMHLYTLKNKVDEGEQLLYEAVRQDETFALAYATLAMRMLNQRRLTEGLELLKEAEKHSYRLDIDTKFQLATFGSIFKGQHERAHVSLTQWLTLYPDSIQAWTAKVNLHSILNQREEAILAIEKLLELEPYGIHRYLHIGQLYTSLGNIDKAIEAFETYAEKNPSDPRVYIMLGDTYRRLGNFELSNKEYTQAQILETNSIQADRRLLENLKRQGDFEKAELGYLNLIEEANSNQTKYELIRELAELYRETGQNSAALNTFEDSYQIQSSFAPEITILMIKMFDSWSFVTMGQAERGQELIDEAHAALERFDNDLFRANLIITTAMFKVFLGDNEDPIAKIDEAHQKVIKFVGDGDNQTISMIKGIAYHLTDQPAQAIPHLEGFLTSYPNSQLALWVTLADCYLQDGNFTKAIEIYQELLKEYPAYPSAHFGLAKAHFEQGNYEQAKAAINIALSGWSNADETHEDKQLALQLAEQIAKS